MSKRPTEAEYKQLRAAQAERNREELAAKWRGYVQDAEGCLLDLRDAIDHALSEIQDWGLKEEPFVPLGLAMLPLCERQSAIAEAILSLNEAAKVTEEASE